MKRSVRKYPPTYLRWLLFTDVEYAPWGFFQRREGQLRYLAPVRYFLLKDIPNFVRRKRQELNTAVWWVRHRTTDKNHIVNTGLQPGWNTPSDRIYHSAFEVMRETVQHKYLSRYYEDELFSNIQIPQHKDIAILNKLAEEYGNERIRDLADLYVWWVYEYPNRACPWDRSSGYRRIMTKTKQKTKRWYGGLFVPTVKTVFIDGDPNDPFTALGPKVDSVRHAVSQLYEQQMSDNFKRLASLMLLL